MANERQNEMYRTETEEDISAAKQQNMDRTIQEKAFRPLSELNLIDDYMFDVATLDLEICKSIIELSLNIRIQEIRWKEGQKVVHNLPSKRGVRLDFYVKDMQGTVFNVEMQKRRKGDLPKRTRYYTALLDSPLLKMGEHSFDKLPPTYVIVICGFDYFGQGKYRYTFQSRCAEDTRLILENGLTTVFLNTKGENVGEVEPELIAFLRFVENSTAEEARQSSDPRIHHMYGKINHLKNHAEVEADYMTAEEYRRMIEDDAREVGMKAGMQKEAEKGMKILVEFCKEAGWTKETAVKKLVEKYQVSQEKAEQIVAKHFGGCL